MEQLFSQQTQKWFAREVGTPTAVQAEGWPHIAAGENVLISAPTGTGKTLTAFLAFIDRFKAQAEAGELPEALCVIYVSPLKSLAADIRENLKRSNEGIAGPQLRMAMRTGDTTSYERQKMLTHPPHILITTPESLYLLLTSPRSRKMLRTAQAVIVDEMHVLIGTKRGAHLMLSLARLDELCGRRLQRIGLSATIQPLQRAADYLAYPSPCMIVAPEIRKGKEIRVLSPLPDLRAVQGTIWPDIARQVYALCRSARTVIAFVEGRQQAERLAYEVNLLGGEGFARTHHGCVSKEQRREAEEQLRNGQLRLLCATSSMELGIDVGFVDLVLQVGCPRSISGELQRLGRAGHRPGEVSVMRVFAKTAADVLDCGLITGLAMEGRIEPARVPQGCLDVLAQHLTSMAADGEYTVEDALRVVHGCWSFQNITKEDICACLRMLAGDWEHEQDRPVRARVLYDRIHGCVSGDAYTRMLAVSAGGTIPDRGWYAVVLADGTHLGELDEEFVFEAHVGDKFLLGAFAWRIQEIRRDRVVVAPTTGEGAQPPFWRGEGQGRAYETGIYIGKELEELERSVKQGALIPALEKLHMDRDAAANAARHLRSQLKATGVLPTHRRILCEHFVDDAGDHQLMVHSVFGGQVNSALALLCRYEAMRRTGQDIHVFDDDNGFLLYLVGSAQLPDGLLEGLDPEKSVEKVRALLPAAPLFSMTFRYAASCALMLGSRGRGRQPLWVQRIRGAEQFSALAEEKTHPLMREAMRSCTEDYLDLDALQKVLHGIRDGSIEVRELHLDAPSPMALPMRRAAEASLTYEYDNIPSRAVRAVERELEKQEGIVPEAQAIEEQFRRKHLPGSPEELHQALMAEGDLAAGEMDVPVEWLTRLAEQGRARYIEPGLWIAEEEAALYADALETGKEEALRRIVRRCLRYRGGQNAESLDQRYLAGENRLAAALDALQKEGRAVCRDGIYYHEQIYTRAQQDTLKARRSSVRTVPPERFAALMAERTRHSGTSAEQLRAALDELLGQAFLRKTWESELLPARVSGFTPKMLDELLAEGEYCWAMEGQALRFFRTENVDWDAELPKEEIREEDERIVLETLKKRGACFASALSAQLKGKSALEPLLHLAHKGLVRSDSLTPLRVEEEVLLPGKTDGRRLAAARARALSAGRWELARPERPLTEEEALNRAFDACPILCRETITGVAWPQAVEKLRVWEYTGRVRRGYFVQGLSGMQFVRAEEYERICAVLASPSGKAVWLPAPDPAQSWGRLLPHAPGREFLRVPGTAVCLCGGCAAAVLEKSGEQLRLFEPEAAESALGALARDFTSRRVFPERENLRIKTYPACAVSAMKKAGFVRVMLDYVLYRE